MIEEPGVSAAPLQIRHRNNATTVSSRLLIVKVAAVNTAAVKLKVAGTTTPEFAENSLIPFGWLLHRRHFIDEILVSAPPTETDAIIEIAANLDENVLQSECDLAPGISQPVLVGLHVKDSAVFCIGEFTIRLPYEGRVHVAAYNEAYGVLADRWFKLKVESWDKIEFTTES